MNRQELRRKARKKQTIYNLTTDQIASITAEGEKQAYQTMKDGLNQQLREEGKKLTLQAYQQTFFIPLLVLRNEGWGKVRLKRFAQKMIDQMEMLEEDYFNSKDIQEMIKEETGLDLRFDLDFKNQKSTIKVVSE